MHFSKYQKFYKHNIKFMSASLNLRGINQPYGEKSAKKNLLKSHTKSASKKKKKVGVVTFKYTCRSEESDWNIRSELTGSEQGPMEFPRWGLKVSAWMPTTLIKVLSSFLLFLQATARKVLRLEPHLFLPNSVLFLIVNLPTTRR